MRYSPSFALCYLLIEDGAYHHLALLYSPMSKIWHLQVLWCAIPYLAQVLILTLGALHEC